MTITVASLSTVQYKVCGASLIVTVITEQSHAEVLTICYE